MDELLKKLEPFAKKKGFEIYGSVPTTFTKDPDFNKALNTRYTVDFAEGDQTKTLGQWLSTVTNIPKTDRLKLNIEGIPHGGTKDVGALSKQVYFAIFGGENVDDLFDDEQEKQKALQGAITYLATEKLGDAILDVLDSPMGSVNDHEGVVIRDDKISPKPFKVTGKFITGGVSSDFQKK
jgi:GH15 family glucan-1,4-alpha-glucosidase